MLWGNLGNVISKDKPVCIATNTHDDSASKDSRCNMLDLSVCTSIEKNILTPIICERLKYNSKNDENSCDLECLLSPKSAVKEPSNADLAYQSTNSREQ